MPSTFTLQKARDFATKYHWGQMYADKPYTYHLDKVYNNLYTLGTALGPDVHAAAYLHDVIEDTKATFSNVCSTFDYNMACLVYSVTNVKSSLDSKTVISANPNLITKEQIDTTIWIDGFNRTADKILANPNGVPLKLCDRISNVDYCVSTYKDGSVSAIKLAKYCKFYAMFRSKLFVDKKFLNMWQVLDERISEGKKLLGNY